MAIKIVSLNQWGVNWIVWDYINISYATCDRKREMCWYTGMLERGSNIFKGFRSNLRI